MTDDLASALAYNRWADARVLDACRQIPPDRFAAEVAPGWPSVRSTLVHLAWAADAWSRRFLGETVAGPISEANLATLDAAAGLLLGAQDRLERLVSGLTAAELAAPFTYQNFRGQIVTAPLWAALRHVVNHGTYHRGQVATKLRRLGVEPPITDLVAWAIERTSAAGPEDLKASGDVQANQKG